MQPQKISFNLGDHFDAFIEAQVQQGRYASASDVVRAALQLLEEQEAHVKALEDALEEGLNSGTPMPFDFDEFLRERHAEVEKK